MNFYLNEVPISILKIEKVSGGFHARFGALERTYIYKILNRRAKPSIDLNRAWHVMLELDVEKMSEAASMLVGKHDFSAFRAAGCQAPSPIKTINNITVGKNNEIVSITVSAKSFLYHQVRNIAGTLKAVGQNKLSISDFAEILAGKDRTKAGPTAPACGLYFVETRYPSLK
jgi:tRNA pseudouridine38-40 synthase